MTPAKAAMMVVRAAFAAAWPIIMRACENDDRDGVGANERREVARSAMRMLETGIDRVERSL